MRDKIFVLNFSQINFSLNLQSERGQNDFVVAIHFSKG